MNEIAAVYGFSWGEEEETVLRFVRVEEPPPRQSAGMEGIIQHILRAFKDRDLNHLLNFAYGQTEPMLAAKRGDSLDFTLVPVDKTMPAFSPPKAKAADAALHPNKFISTEKYTMPDGSVMEDKVEMTRASG